MNAIGVYPRLQGYFRNLVEENGWEADEILVEGRPLTPREGIGTPARSDFPILIGVERLVEARFKDARGHAFTDDWGNFRGPLREVAGMSLGSNRSRAVFVAALNAVMAHLGLVDRPVHCRDRGPEECAMGLESFLAGRPRVERVALIGLQPALLEALSRLRRVRVSDMNPDNWGRLKSGVKVERGEKAPDLLDWCDLALVTGTTLVNGTIEPFLETPCPVVFYGVTIAAAASILNLERYCPAGLA
ncbi:MAG TPA: DUF364 domain-containing protein [bacterium]|nr:DUF364 domain-containing protein [bacterium]HPQ65398.1 DUF364 domain-containing protein [bacterium]